MKLIDLLNKIANDEIKPIVYFRINLAGFNFIIKYVYFNFVVVKADSSFKKLKYKEENINNIILYSLNKRIEIIENFNEDVL